MLEQDQVSKITFSEKYTYDFFLSLATLLSNVPVEGFFLVILQGYLYHGPYVRQAMVMWPPCWKVSKHLTEQTTTNMSQPGQRPDTAVGDERHVLKAE